MATPIPDNHAAFTASEILSATRGLLVSGTSDVRVIGVSTDTRQVGAQNLFVALRGEAFDGHAFLDRAVSAGASALLVARDLLTTRLPKGVAIIAVDDTLEALGRLARMHRDRWARNKNGRAVVIAITGSAGKTTTKELTVAAIASLSGLGAGVGLGVGDAAVHFTRGNLNNRIGVPMTLLGLEPVHDVAVIEAGMSLRGEMAQLAEVIAPDVAVLTHLGVAHAEGVANPGERAEEAVLREKRALLLAAKSCAIACSDEPLAVAALRGLAARRTCTFGRSERSTHRLIAIVADESAGSQVTFSRGGSALTVTLPLLGNAAALDLIAAVAAAEAGAEVLGAGSLDRDALDASLRRRVHAVPGRLAPRRRRDGALVIDDTYNASPSAYREALDTAAQLAGRSGRRLVVVAGEMRELGLIAIEAHEEVAQAIAAAKPAILVTVGPNAERLAAPLAASSSGAAIHHAESSERAAELVAPLILAKDLVLVKGSRGVATERVVDAILARGGEIEDARAAGRADSAHRGETPATTPHGRGR